MNSYNTDSPADNIHLEMMWELAMTSSITESSTWNEAVNFFITRTQNETPNERENDRLWKWKGI